MDDSRRRYVLEGLAAGYRGDHVNYNDIPTSMNADFGNGRYLGEYLRRLAGQGEIVPISRTEFDRLRFDLDNALAVLRQTQDELAQTKQKLSAVEELALPEKGTW